MSANTDFIVVILIYSAIHARFFPTRIFFFIYNNKIFDSGRV